MVDAELGHGLMVLEDGWKLEWRLSAGASVDRSGSDVGCRARVRRWQRWYQQVSSEGEVEQSLAVRRHYSGRVRRVPGRGMHGQAEWRGRSSVRGGENRQRWRASQFGSQARVERS